MSTIRTAKRVRDEGPRHQARRDRILDIAVEAFRERGYAGTSTQDIGRALQMSKGSLYYYFRDKEGILFGCHERALDHLLAVARDVKRRRPDPEAALRELIERHVGVMVQEFRGTALALELGHLTGPRRERVVSRRDQYENILREVLDEGVHAGVFRPVNTRLAAFAILGAINWMARWYRESGPAAAEEIGRTFADLYARALLDGRAPAARRAARRRARTHYRRTTDAHRVARVRTKKP